MRQHKPQGMKHEGQVLCVHGGDPGHIVAPNGQCTTSCIFLWRRITKRLQHSRRFSRHLELRKCPEMEILCPNPIHHSSESFKLECDEKPALPEYSRMSKQTLVRRIGVPAPCRCPDPAAQARCLPRSKLHWWLARTQTQP